MVTQRQSMDHTTRPGQEPEGTPSPGLWSLCHHCRALHGNTSALLMEGQSQETHAELRWPAWVGPQPPLRAGLGKGGHPCTPLPHSLDDSTLLPLEGGAGGWPGQQQLLLVNQAVQQVFLAVVVVNLQERQGGDRQPGQPRGPQAKLQRR